MRKAWMLGFALAGCLLQCTNGAGTQSAGEPSFGSSPRTPWAMPLRDGPGGATSVATAASAAPDGTLFLGGTFYGTLDLGLAPLTSLGGADVVVAKIDPSGRLLWAKRFGDGMDQIAHAVSAAPDGGVVVTGEFAGTLDVAQDVSKKASRPAGATPAPAVLRALGAKDIFVMKLDADGAVVWAAQFGGDKANAEASGVAVGPTGAVALTGSFDHAVSFDGDRHVSGAFPSAFVSSLDPATGHALWTWAWGDGVGMRGKSVSVDGQGDVVATGTFGGTVDFGSGPVVSHGGTDVYLVKIHGDRIAWSKTFGDPWDDYAAAVVTDTPGDIVTLGQYTGTVDLGTGPHSANGAAFFGSSDVFVAKYDAAGHADWVSNFGASNRVDWADALALAPNGTVYFSARIFNPFQVGDCVVSPTLAEYPPGQAVVAQVSASGDGVCVRRYGEGKWSQVRALAVHPAMGLLLIGAYEGPINLGEGNIAENASASGGFAAHQDVFPPPTPNQ
jgi:hypothetical protein